MLDIDYILDELNNIKKINKKLMAIIESSYDGIYVTDGNALTIIVNKSYEELTGLKRENLIGRKMDDLVREGIISQSGSLETMKTKKSVTMEQTFKNGKKVLISSSPIFDDNGNISNIITNVRDVTELYDLKNKLVINQNLAQKYSSEIETIKSQLLDCGNLVAEDELMIETLRIIKKVAKVDTTMLLLGETGVGKEEIAKYIHKNSSRADKHFIKINCGAIPENLIESELFGYEKGAFTGAKKEGKMGLFQVADKGTIFLDEIGDLPLDMQVKLLRVLQEREFEKVGGIKPIKIDVRILAATNRSLEKMVRKKLFRQDLYFRINVVPIVIPPLRNRKKDIAALANHFIAELNKKYNMNKSFSPSAIQSLLEYDWPGNVRELKNIVERVVIMSGNNQIYRSDLPFKAYSKSNRKAEEVFNKIILKEEIEKFELEYINKYYSKFNSVRKAAEMLGMDSSTFVRKRQKYTERYTKNNKELDSDEN